MSAPHRRQVPDRLRQEERPRGRGVSHGARLGADERCQRRQERHLQQHTSIYGARGPAQEVILVAPATDAYRNAHLPVHTHTLGRDCRRDLQDEREQDGEWHDCRVAIGAASATATTTGVD